MEINPKTFDEIIHDIDIRMSFFNDRNTIRYLNERYQDNKRPIKIGKDENRQAVVVGYGKQWH